MRTKRVTLSVKVDHLIAAKIKRLASREKRTVNNYLALLLEKLTTQ